MSTTALPRRAPKAAPSQSWARGNGFLFASALGSSPQAVSIQENLCAIAEHRARPPYDSRHSLRERFRQLARQWRAETRFLSSTTDSAMHPAYQAIVGMGPEALPLILADLRDNSGHWYWALKAISEEDPVPPADRGAIEKMKAAWMKWGAAKVLVTA